MSELTNWKTLCKKESWGRYNFGVEIRVSVPRPLNENDTKAMYRIEEQIEDAVMRETLRLDPEQRERRVEERTKLLACFGDLSIFAEEIPNGYSNQWYYEMSPWYRITTKGVSLREGFPVAGLITLGWRKRVIEITWNDEINKATAEQLFPAEEVTKIGRTIHAWSYEKAATYISRILSVNI
jgi:hypothetical protein